MVKKVLESLELIHIEKAKNDTIDTYHTTNTKKEVPSPLQKFCEMQR